VLAGSGNEACDAYSAIAAGESNIVSSGGGATQSFIGAGNSNLITGSQSVIGGGYDNQVPANDAAIVGGSQNQASALHAFVGAGTNNLNSSDDGVVVGGYNNNASGTEFNFIGAGSANAASATYGIVVGGQGNTASGTTASVLSGNNNQNAGIRAIIGSGENNTITNNGTDGLIAAGNTNTLSGVYGVIGGGEFNNVSGEGGYVAAGGYNTVAGEGAVIDGGFNSTAAGAFATIPGGYVNSAGGTYSLAAGARASAAQTGTFVWSDGSDGDTILTSSSAYQFLARASGGFTLYTNPASTVGAQLAAGSGTWASLSDRNAKTNVAPIDDARVLEKVARLPISRWSYRTEHGVRHVGPMAQDFYVAFNVGEDDKHITSIDEDGIALAAIKALYVEDKALHRENAALRARLADVTTDQSTQIAILRSQVAALARNAPGRRSGRPGKS